MIVFSLLCAAHFYAQAAENIEKTTPESRSEIDLGTWDFFFTLDPCLYVNTDSESAPSPIQFSGGIGLDFFNDRAVSFQPKLSFFTNYFLWNGSNARPAEVENRTAQVFNFLFDLDAVHTILFKNSALQAGGGISILARFAVTASGVDGSDDVSKINSWFYEDLNFLYPNLNLSWMRKMESQWIAGFETRVYFPLGAISSGRGLDTMILSLGVKVQRNFSKK